MNPVENPVINPPRIMWKLCPEFCENSILRIPKYFANDFVRILLKFSVKLMHKIFNQTFAVTFCSTN